MSLYPMNMVARTTH